MVGDEVSEIRRDMRCVRSLWRHGGTQSRANGMEAASKLFAARRASKQPLHCPIWKFSSFRFFSLKSHFFAPGSCGMLSKQAEDMIGSSSMDGVQACILHIYIYRDT